MSQGRHRGGLAGTDLRNLPVRTTIAIPKTDFLGYVIQRKDCRRAGLQDETIGRFPVGYGVV